MLVKPAYAALALLLTAPTLAHAQPPAPIVGGWSAVEQPAKNAEVRAAAKALLAALPLRHKRLAKIEVAEQQVVAGMNYRLTLRLANGTRWSGVVWHKLDGTYDAQKPERLR